MKHYQAYLYILFAFLFHLTISRQNENISDLSKRLTHAIIHGEVHGNGSLPINDEKSHLIVELRLTRDARPKSIGRTKITLQHVNSTQSFILKFKLKYPLSKISPHNSYVLTAQIRNGENKLIYIGDLHVPVTEKREQQAKKLIINVIETRKFKKFCVWIYSIY